LEDIRAERMQQKIDFRETNPVLIYKPSRETPSLAELQYMIKLEL